MFSGNGGRLLQEIENSTSLIDATILSANNTLSDFSPFGEAVASNIVADVVSSVAADVSVDVASAVAAETGSGVASDVASGVSAGIALKTRICLKVVMCGSN